jgi:alpha-L-fucosidase 2
LRKTILYHAEEIFLEGIIIMRNNVLTYENPARIWEEGLMLGNGSVGAMVYGGVDQETIQFNHDTFWSGHVKRGEELDFPSPISTLNEVRNLLFDEKHTEAKGLLRTLFTQQAQAYMPLAFLRICYQDVSGKYFDYKRTLSLDTAVMDISYSRKCSSLTQNYTSFERTMFISKPHDVFVLRITSKLPRKICMRLTLDSDVMHSVKSIGSDSLLMEGQAPTHMEPMWNQQENSTVVYDENHKSVKFNMMMKAQTKEGSVDTISNGIRIMGASEVTIYINAQTSFVSFNEDPIKEMNCAQVIKRAIDDGFEKVKSDHIADYQALYNRSCIKIDNSNEGDVATDKRLEKFRQNPSSDIGMGELLFNFGKYLFISSSRKGSQATNLQGIWNGVFRQMWMSNYTININTEMNYWLAEVCNLSECHEPLFKFIEELSISGERTAKNYFGCRGFSVSHNTDLWRHTIPCGSTCGFWPMAGVWFCQHLWEHYLFTLDKEFLNDVCYPITKKAVLFVLDWLVPDKDGHYTTSPSTSPENSFFINGEQLWVTTGSAMDLMMAEEIFKNFKSMTSILNIDDELLVDVDEKLSKLKPLSIGSDGRILEWDKEFEECQPGHRHISQLYGLHPSNIIDESTPELLRACEASLDARLKNGGGSTGWSRGWIIHQLARLKRGNECLDSVNYIIKNLMYDNLFDAHPPFQIDGNFALVSGIAEMLIQSHSNKITLLPALPDEWKKGSFSGLRARGGYTVSVEWSEGMIQYFKLVSDRGEIIESHAPIPFGSTVKEL